MDEPIINDEIDSLMIVEFRDRLQLQVGSQIQLPATIVFDHPRLSDLAAHLLASFEGSEKVVPSRHQPEAPAQRQLRPASPADDTEPIEEMSEQQAMEALLREVND